MDVLLILYFLVLLRKSWRHVFSAEIIHSGLVIIKSVWLRLKSCASRLHVEVVFRRALHVVIVIFVHFDCEDVSCLAFRRALSVFFLVLVFYPWHQRQLRLLSWRLCVLNA